MDPTKDIFARCILPSSTLDTDGTATYTSDTFTPPPCNYVLFGVFFGAIEASASLTVCRVDHSDDGSNWTTGLLSSSIVGVNMGSLDDGHLLMCVNRKTSKRSFRVVDTTATGNAIVVEAIVAIALGNSLIPPADTARLYTDSI